MAVGPGAEGTESRRACRLARCGAFALRVEVPDRRVRSREEEPLLARIAPADDVRRFAVGAMHLEDFPVAVRLSHAMALHDDTVTHGRLHEDLRSALLPATFPVPTIGSPEPLG